MTGSNFDHFFVEEFSVAGFRAYLSERKFELGKKKRSLAVYAPNASGKSSIADAFEFFLSEHGSVERLGLQGRSTQGGAIALRHVHADKRGITPAVSMIFRSGSERFGDQRLVGDTLPASAARVANCLGVSPVIRGWSLRRFVEGVSETDRYEEIAKWFDLDRLVVIQECLQKLTREYKKQADDCLKLEERLRDLSKINSNLKKWDEIKILDWINQEILEPIVPSLRLDNLDVNSHPYRKILHLKDKEDSRLGIPGLRLLKDAILTIFAKQKHHDDETDHDGPDETGALTEFSNAVSDRGTANKNF